MEKCHRYTQLGNIQSKTLKKIATCSVQHTNTDSVINLIYIKQAAQIYDICDYTSDYYSDAKKT